MANRFCSRCNAEVEDAGGFCLLGHDLRLEAPVDSLKALRAEVNRTFDEARAELADVMAPAAALAPELAELAQPAGVHGTYPPKGQSVRLDEALVIEGADDEREWSDVPVSVAPPGEPVDVAQNVEARASTQATARPGVWDGLDEAAPLMPGDPITTFAPSPRMDWGPRKARLLGRRARPDEQHAEA